MRFRAAPLVIAMAALALAGPAFVTRTAREAPPSPQQVTISEPQQVTVSEMQLAQGWLWDLFGGRSRERPQSDSEDFETRRPDASGKYRALCVRLCDGFPYPISYASTRDRLSTNARQCEQSCPGRSRLFVHRQPGEGLENMVDLQGRPYRELPTAFRFRSEYDASCTCQGNPWDEQTLARHRAYAEAERAAKSKAAATERSARSREASRRDGRAGRPSRSARWQREDDD
jgi:hypothetical protein